MEIELTPDQKALIDEAVASGRVARPEDAVTEALELWEERERHRLELMIQLEAAERSLAAGRGRTIRSYEETRQLAQEIQERGAARLKALLAKR